MHNAQPTNGQTQMLKAIAYLAWHETRIGCVSACERRSGSVHYLSRKASFAYSRAANRIYVRTPLRTETVTRTLMHLYTLQTLVNFVCIYDAATLVEL